MYSSAVLVRSSNTVGSPPVSQVPPGTRRANATVASRIGVASSRSQSGGSAVEVVVLAVVVLVEVEAAVVGTTVLVEVAAAVVTGVAATVVEGAVDSGAGDHGALHNSTLGRIVEPCQGTMSSTQTAVQSGLWTTLVQRPRQDSNLGTWLRRPMLYPLSYEGGGNSESIRATCRI